MTGKKSNRSAGSSRKGDGAPSDGNETKALLDVDLFETNTSYRASRYDTFEFSSKVTCFAFSKDAPLLAVGVEIGGVYLFDLTQPEASVAAPSELIGIVRSMHFGPQNGFGEQILYGAFDDGHLRRWLIRNMTEMIQIDCLYFGQEVQTLLVSGGGRSVMAVGKQSRLAVWSALYDNCFSYLTVPWLSDVQAPVEDAILLPDILLHPRAPPNADVFHVAAVSPTEGILIFNVIVVEPQYTHHFDVSVHSVRALPGAFHALAATPQHINDQQVIILAAASADTKSQIALISLQPDAENYPGCQIHATLMELGVKPEDAITSVHWINPPEEARLSTTDEDNTHDPSPVPPPSLLSCIDGATQEAPYKRMVLCVGTDKGSILFLECIHVPDKTDSIQQRLRVRLVYDLDGNRGPLWIQEVPSEVVMGRPIFASCCNDTMCHLWELQEVAVPTTTDIAAAHASQRCAYLEMLRHRCMPDGNWSGYDFPFSSLSDPNWPVEPRIGAPDYEHPPYPTLQTRNASEGPPPFRHNRYEGKTDCMHRSLKQTAGDRQRQQVIKTGVDAVVDEVLDRVCKDMSIWEKQNREVKPLSHCHRQLTSSSSCQREKPLCLSSRARGVSSVMTSGLMSQRGTTKSTCDERTQVSLWQPVGMFQKHQLRVIEEKAGSRGDANPGPPQRSLLWRVASTPKGLWNKVADWLRCETTVVSGEQKADHDTTLPSGLQKERRSQREGATYAVATDAGASHIDQQKAASKEARRKMDTHDGDGIRAQQPSQAAIVRDSVPSSQSTLARHLRGADRHAVTGKERAKVTAAPAQTTTTSTMATTVPVKAETHPPEVWWRLPREAAEDRLVRPEKAGLSVRDAAASSETEPWEKSEETEQTEETGVSPSKESGLMPKYELPEEVPASTEGVEPPGGSPYSERHRPRIAVALGLRRYTTGPKYQFGTDAPLLPRLPGVSEEEVDHEDVAWRDSKSEESNNPKVKMPTLSDERGHNTHGNPEPRRLLQQMPGGSTEAMPPNATGQQSHGANVRSRQFPFGDEHVEDHRSNSQAFADGSTEPLEACGRAVPQQGDQEGYQSWKNVNAEGSIVVPERGQQPASEGKQCRPLPPGSTREGGRLEDEQSTGSHIRAGPWRFFIAEED
ncbi:hypothetical protein TGDOM2_261650 [Toxoplasma gondii GAB2-2007-GAL-DOM2]|uniref:Uncharacterized protein n=2 Tax=Toxoplasma gondii TaxID=5811 RepID=V5B8N4_TOXGV|nr:hypothetical protein TGVEG_261650 [Toxoplasma gondii VEG]KFG49442.1 hypothetical protein TGDOM2_261650 [Toxoplasma gondii GAB2-2007-GAL-DOM2]